MSQFAKQRIVKGACFTAIVNSAPFKPKASTSLIDDIILVDSGESHLKAEQTLSELKEMHIGQPYETWLD